MTGQHPVPSDSITTGMKLIIIPRPIYLLLFDADTCSIQVNCDYKMHCAAQPAKLQPMAGILG